MKILFIQTGGTIDKDYPRLQRGYAFEIAEPAVMRILEKANPAFKFEVQHLLKKDSMDIDDADRQKIYETCERSSFDKIIITHGTDTMIETAKILASIQHKTIILTGALRPQRFSNTDADFNLGFAIGAINVLREGVYIAMNGKIFPYDQVQRDEKTGQFVDK